MNDLAVYTQVESMSQDSIIQKYSTMVKRIGHHLLGRLPNNILVDDLIQAGMIGLLEAAKNYDASKGASFETYAGIRIRGHMLDEVRKNDWVPRSVYRNSRMISEAIRKLEHANGRDAKDVEVAKSLDISLNDYHTMLRDTSTAQLYGFEDAGVFDDTMKNGIHAKLDEPDDKVMRSNFKNLVSSCISELPERERLVIGLYYQEELNLKEIGHVLGVSESRVCQIHSQAIHRVQVKVRSKQNLTSND